MFEKGSGFFPTNPDLADSSGNTDFDFENFHCLGVWIPYFQNSGFLDFQITGFLDLGTRFLAMAGCEGGGAPVAGSRRFLDGTPRPQNSGDPWNQAIL